MGHDPNMAISWVLWWWLLGVLLSPVCKIIWSTITWLANWIGVLNMTKFRAALNSIFEPCSHFDWPPASVAYSLAELWSLDGTFRGTMLTQGKSASMYAVASVLRRGVLTRNHWHSSRNFIHNQMQRQNQHMPDMSPEGGLEARHRI